MNYFLIAGEASGDLHASHLIAALKARDAEARFSFYGGDMMAAAAGEQGRLLRHYKTLAYMGFVQVALHARTILQGLQQCKASILAERPDCIILIDYPGFNLKMAKFVHEAHLCPVFYYISPKIWAWKEGRIKSIRAYVDRLFSILPFEVDFYEKKHRYPISYVGNPTYDEVATFLAQRGEDILHPVQTDRNDVIALLPGSRKQEIRANLRVMLQAVQHENRQRHCRIFISKAPNIEDSFYEDIVKAAPANRDIRYWKFSTYELLRQARIALVTSGTATLETALLDVPQVVCYKMTGGRFINWILPHFLSCHFISLVNLIANREVVPELIAADMNPRRLRYHIDNLIEGPAREAQLQGYADIRQRLNSIGAPERTAEEIISLIQRKEQ